MQGSAVMKGKVLQSAFFFSFFYGLWCINPYDIFFPTNGLWWGFWFFGCPFILWCYEAILFRWIRVANQQLAPNSRGGGGLAGAVEKSYRERFGRAIPKVLLFGASAWATHDEYQLHACGCSCPLAFGTYRTTAGFSAWAFVASVTTIAYFSAFAIYGRYIKRELQARAGNAGTSKDAEKIGTFLWKTTKIIILAFVALAAYSLFPVVLHWVNFTYILIQRFVFGRLILLMIKCIRTPDMKLKEWCRTCGCTDRSQSLLEQVGGAGDNAIVEMEKMRESFAPNLLLRMTSALPPREQSSPEDDARAAASSSNSLPRHRSVSDVTSDSSDPSRTRQTSHTLGGGLDVRSPDHFKHYQNPIARSKGPSVKRQSSAPVRSMTTNMPDLPSPVHEEHEEDEEDH